jgi:probable F420-dependent oxidoreductase
MEFGITFKGDIAPERTIALCRQAEKVGFNYAWFFDSHVMAQECFCMIAACARETKRLRLGPCVTNPQVRDWTLAASIFATLSRFSNHRIDAGIGRGESSVRALGRKPASVKTMVEFAESLRAMVRGDGITYRRREVRLTWSNTSLPIWIAAYGPKALGAAGIYSDGLIVQLADPWLVRWLVELAKNAGASAGRDMTKFRVMVAAPAWVGDIEIARTRARWFPAMVGRHVADLVERYGKDKPTIPKHLVDYVEERKARNYVKHAESLVESSPSPSNEIVDSFGMLGPPESHVDKLRELQQIGVTQFNVYLMCGEEERQIAEYGDHIIPKFRSRGAA